MEKEEKKEKKPARTMFVARRRRNEVGIGVVEVGQTVDLAAHLPPDAVAALVSAGIYAPAGDLPDDVAEALKAVKGG